jgi:hypothetical protein
VVHDPVLFLPLWYCAPKEMKPRLLFLEDPPASLRYLNFHRGSMVAHGQLGAPVLPYDRFATPGKEFLLYIQSSAGWIVPKALDDGSSVEVVEARGSTMLLRIHVK